MGNCGALKFKIKFRILIKEAKDSAEQPEEQMKPQHLYMESHREGCDQII